jgi:hypothetical protein
MEDAKGTAAKAEENLRGVIRALNALNGGRASQNEINVAIAKNVMLEDIGTFGDPNPVYGLSEGDKDRLLAHARQDAANAMLNSANALEEILILKFWAKSTFVAVIVGISALYFARQAGF